MCRSGTVSPTELSSHSFVRSSDVVGVHRSQRIRGPLLVQVRDSFPDVVVIVIVVISAVPDVMG